MKQSDQTNSDSYLNPAMSQSGTSPDLGDTQTLWSGPERLIHRLGEILARKQSVLLSVTLGEGLDKVQVVRTIGEEAHKQGWKVAPGPEDGELEVQTETTLGEFSSRVQSLLAKNVIPGSIAGAEKGANLSAGSSAHQGFDPLVQFLRQHPVMLLILTCYQPESAFDAWFQGSFIKDLKRSDAAVVVVVVDSFHNVKVLSSVADQFAFVGALDLQSVQEQLASIGEKMLPPMDEAELQSYLEAIRQDPGIQGLLVTTLALVRSNR